MKRWWPLLLVVGFSPVSAETPPVTAPVQWQAGPPQADEPAADPAIVLRSGEEKDADTLARIWLSYDAKNLYLRYRVFDTSPLCNSGQEAKTLFKTGDSVDLQLGLNPKAAAGRTAPEEGDLRLLMTQTAQGPAAVLYRYRVPGTADPVRFWSPVGEVTVDRVEQPKAIELVTEKLKDGYVLRAVIPWSALAGKELAAPTGTTLRGDVGVLFSDPDGATTVERVYWSNKDTSVVADVPSEIRLHPDRWGRLNFLPQKPSSTPGRD